MIRKTKGKLRAKRKAMRFVPKPRPSQGPEWHALAKAGLAIPEPAATNVR